MACSDIKTLISCHGMNVLVYVSAPVELVAFLEEKGWTEQGPFRGNPTLHVLRKKMAIGEFISLFEGRLATLLTFKFAPIFSLSTEVSKNGYTYTAYPMVQDVYLENEKLSSGQFVDKITGNYFHLATYPGAPKQGQNPDARFFAVSSNAPEEEILRFIELGGIKGNELALLTKTLVRDGPQEIVFRMGCTKSHFLAMEGVEIVQRYNIGLINFVVLSFRGFHFRVCEVGFTPYGTKDASNFKAFFSDRAPVLVADYVVPLLPVEEKRTWGDIAEAAEISRKVEKPVEQFPALPSSNVWKAPLPKAEKPSMSFDALALNDPIVKAIQSADKEGLNVIEKVLRNGLVLLEAMRRMKFD